MIHVCQCEMHTGEGLAAHASDYIERWQFLFDVRTITSWPSCVAQTLCRIGLDCCLPPNVHVPQPRSTPSPPLHSFRGYIERVSAIVNYLLDSPFGPLTPQQMHKKVGVKNIHSHRMRVPLRALVWVSRCACVCMGRATGLRYKTTYSPYNTKHLSLSLSFFSSVPLPKYTRAHSHWGTH